jgi:hypothetical protein
MRSAFGRAKQRCKIGSWSIFLRGNSRYRASNGLTLDAFKRSCGMQTAVELPKAFSVRDEHEFLPVQHLMTRLNPSLCVTRVATGKHADGDATVFWGLVYLEGRPLLKKDVEAALREAGFDFGRNILIRALDLWIGCPNGATSTQAKWVLDSQPVAD